MGSGLAAQEHVMKETFVLTGATSGFGAAALELLCETIDNPILVGARHIEPLKDKYGDRVRALPLDLGNLQSIRNFCDQCKDETIGVLGMNAGIQTRTLAATPDGFETTFQTNYLSHFLMFKLLKDRLIEGALVVTTGSGTHDPDEKTPVPAPKHANVDWLAYLDGDPKPDKFTPLRLARAYSTSKLLCIMMAREIAQRYPHLKAISFDPGYLPDTKLTREYPAFITALIKPLIPMMMKNDRSGSVATTAPEYARILMGGLSPDNNGGYIVMRSGKGIEAPPSQLARKPDVASTAWEKSLKLLAHDVR